MKPDIDMDLEQLEMQLRRSAVGHKPAAPAALHDFIDQMPSRYPASRPRLALLSRPAARRGLMAAAISAAIVAGAATTALLVSVRQQQAASPSASVRPSQSITASPLPSARQTGPVTPTLQVSWQQVADPSPSMVAKVANGFIGKCVANGRPAVCTSADGITWSLTPDPAIFVVDSGGVFNGWSVAFNVPTTTWVATGTTDPGTWRSTDGVHWTQVNLGVSGLQDAHVEPLGGGFLMVARAFVGNTPHDVVLTSGDGAGWTSHPLPAGVTDVQLAGAAGALATKPSADATAPVTTLLSPDGMTWNPATLPGNNTLVSQTLRLAPSGTLLGIANDVSGPANLVTSSDDGATWQFGSGLTDQIYSLITIGRSAFAVANVPGTATVALWQSVDGSDWTRLDVTTADATVAPVYDRLGLFEGSVLKAVGTVGEGAAPTTTPETTPTLGPSGSATPAPSDVSVIVGGWRWHKMNTLPDGAVIHPANGYIGHCGTAMCTSPNGWSWLSPPDPAIFSADPTAVFVPQLTAHRPGRGYVALSGRWL